MLGGYLAAGGAGAINHYIEREKDARMARTRSRPLASGRISPARGLAFGVGLGVAATVQLAVTVNLLTSVLALSGLLGYVFIYTLWLKPRTPQNIVSAGPRARSRRSSAGQRRAASSRRRRCGRSRSSSGPRPTSGRCPC